MENDNITIPLKELERRFKEIYKRLAVIAGNEIVNFSLDNFKRQGFLGDTFQPWRPRKVINKWGKIDRNPNRSILVLTGKLRRGTRIIRANYDGVLVGNNVPYARAHNEGLRGLQVQHVKDHTRKVSTIAKVSSLATKKTSNRKVEAFRSNVKAHSRTIKQNLPARPFLKDSPYLRRKIQIAIASAILKALK